MQADKEIHESTSRRLRFSPGGFFAGIVMTAIALVSALVLDFDGQCETWVPFLVSGHECSFLQFLTSDAPGFTAGWLRRYWAGVLALVAIASTFPWAQMQGPKRAA